MKIMYFKMLFLLACYNLYRSARSFVKENVVVGHSQQTEISSGAFVSFGMTVLFYVMVISICVIPSILF